ncbi:MAG: FAD-binding oxidoreductase [Gemmatimonadetes bacterium]|nr:FAD-binding oxidoreductase [Gemmatimonadota bacterium]MCC6770089.1 FAD-binding oxidoreductase [Gemmatimonadaceae bacterium]
MVVDWRSGGKSLHANVLKLLGLRSTSDGICLTVVGERALHAVDIPTAPRAAHQRATDAALLSTTLTEASVTDLAAPSLVQASTSVDVGALAAFEEKLKGCVITPAGADYERARHVWNGHIDRRPAVIVRCRGVADVIDAVKFAREHALLVAVRGGAHNVAGHGTCDGGMVIDLSGMGGVDVDPAARTARAYGGALWRDLDREAQAFGLATTGGTVSNTGVVGLTLGGGLGWLMGTHGLSADSLLSASVVTAAGQAVRASATENADLFWGLRGGGGNFGVVTSMDFQLHPVGPLVLGGPVFHPLAAAREVLRFYREFCADLPDEAEAFAGCLALPDGTPVVALILGYNGPLATGEKVLAPARAFGTPLVDMVGPLPYAARNAMLDVPFGIHGLHRYWKSGVTNTLSDALIDAVAVGAEGMTSPLSALLFFRVHGAAARVPSGDTAFSLRQDQWDVNVVSQWSQPAECSRHIEWTRRTWGDVEPLISGATYVNHLAADDTPERVRASFGTNYLRLAGVKRTWDADNLFRLNPNILPA